MKCKKADVWAVAGRAFPEYRGRSFRVSIAGVVTLHDLNWGGGTRNVYKAVPLTREGAANGLPTFSPWNNPAEGKTLEIPAGWAVVEHTVFCGTDLGLTVHVGTGDMARVLPNGLPGEAR